MDHDLAARLSPTVGLLPFPCLSRDSDNTAKVLHGFPQDKTIDPRASNQREVFRD